MLRWYYVFNTHAHINMTTIVDTGPCILQFSTFTIIFIHSLHISVYYFCWLQNCRGSNHTGSETSPICEGVVGLRQHQLQREDHTTDGSREGCGHLNVCRAAPSVGRSAAADVYAASVGRSAEGWLDASPTCSSMPEITQCYDSNAYFYVYRSVYVYICTLQLCVQVVMYIYTRIRMHTYFYIYQIIYIHNHPHDAHTKLGQVPCTASRHSHGCRRQKQLGHSGANATAARAMGTMTWYWWFRL